MKYLNVGAQVLDYENNPIENIRDGKKSAVLIKDILNQYVIGYLGSDTSKVILAWRIGQKIFDAETEVALEDAEFDLINEAISHHLDLAQKGDRRAVQHSAALLGPVLQELKNAERKAEEQGGK